MRCENIPTSKSPLTVKWSRRSYNVPQRYNSELVDDVDGADTTSDRVQVEENLYEDD